MTHLSLTGIPAFRRPELQQFCRDPPQVSEYFAAYSDSIDCFPLTQEFNTTQRAAFCVYSGKGVSELRDFLNELFNTITEEIAAGSSTEYDDDFEEDYRGRHNYAGEDMQGVNEGDDEQEEEDEEEEPTPSPPLEVQAHPNPPGPVLPAPVNRELFLTREPAHHPRSRAGGMALPPRPIVTSPRRVRGFGQQPIVETSTSPTPSDVASNRSAGTNSNGTGWFRNYVVEANSATLRQGVLTPDLVFAEIGHGRGAGPSTAPVPGPSTVFIAPGRRSLDAIPTQVPPGLTFGNAVATFRTSVGHLPLRSEEPDEPEDTPMQIVDESSPSAPSSSGSEEQGRAQDAELARSNIHTENGFHHSSSSDISNGWTSVPRDRSSSPTTRELQESVHSVLGGHPAYRDQHGADVNGREVDARGRSVKRSIRSTFSAAEQYASSFFFGRSSSSGHEGAGPGGPSGVNARDGDTHGH